MKSLAETLREKRIDAGLSRDELAARLGVTRQVVSRWETGRSEPGPDLLRRIARELGVEASSLRGGAATQKSNRKFVPMLLGAIFLLCFIVDLRYGALVRALSDTPDGLGFVRVYYFVFLFFMYAVLGGALASAALALSGGRLRLHGAARRGALGASLLLLAVYAAAAALLFGGASSSSGLSSLLVGLLGAYLQYGHLRVLLPLACGVLLRFGVAEKAD